MARERMVKEFYFDKDKDWKEQLEKLQAEGWQDIAGEPIEEITVKIVGRRFVFERR